jgi:DNA invertase Pin-like site-specific DNA recombinase
MNHSEPATHQLTKANRPKRAVIFTRARSLPPDPERESSQLEAQERHCRQVAEGLRAEVVQAYTVRAGTTDAAMRHMVEKLFVQVEAEKIDYVIAASLDRLGRRPAELARIVQRLAAAGTSLVTTADPREAFLQDVSLFCLVAKTNERRAA